MTINLRRNCCWLFLTLLFTLLLPTETWAEIHYHWVQLQAGKQKNNFWLPDLSIRAIVDAQDPCPALYDGPKRDKAKRLYTLEERAKRGEVASTPFFKEIKLCERTISADDALLQQWGVGYLAGDKKSSPIQLPDLRQGAMPLSQLITSGCTGCRDNKEQFCATTPPAGSKNRATALPWLLTALNQQAFSAPDNSLPPLWVHLGDMRYSGQKEGVIDSWSSSNGKLGWKEEFFAPYATLLAQSWSVILRGNHEGCFVKNNDWDNSGWNNRGEGWLYFFGSGNQECQDIAGKEHDLLAPIAFDAQVYGGSSSQPQASKQKVRLLFLDLVRTGDGRDKNPQQTQELYRLQYNHIAKQWLTPLSAEQPAWIFQHIPAYETTKKGELDKSVFYKALQSSDLQAELPKVALLLSAHLHQFAWVQPSAKQPLQIIVGNGGVALSGAPGSRCAWNNKAGQSAGQSIHFGFLNIQFNVSGQETTAQYRIPLFRPAPGTLQQEWQMICTGDKNAPLRPHCQAPTTLPPC
ncbi:metallophosphoesterase [Candidatus Magnetaquicoccus inordinatus]|uniref:metallophosphoesterase n=1 Tax=Candidatus Magnetaquicoccus inordinatus TaxID=2496818 RepID=UPI00102BF028|nr:metallophosphoesterase [Candidatus Magnetaquicoccus inordinatus]